jgi:Holliday junction resolvase RusA-like endonuclease
VAEILAVRVYGVPVPQGRPRARAFRLPNGGVRASVYERAEDKDWKRTVLAQVLPHRPPAPVDGPLVMTVTFYLPRPKSLPKRVEYPVTKPDLSNCLKAIEDALNGIVFVDDSRLVEIRMAKRYDPAPGAEIRIAHAPAWRHE